MQSRAFASGTRTLRPNKTSVVTLIGPFPRPYGGVSIHLFRLRALLVRHGIRVRALAQGRQAPIVHVDRYLANSLYAHWRSIGEPRPDLIHIHHAISPLTFLATFRARCARIPVVITVHGTPSNVFTRRRGYDLFLRTALRLSSHVIAVNHELESRFRRMKIGTPVSCLPAYLPPQKEEATLTSTHVQRWLSHTMQLGPLFSMVVYKALSVTPTHGQVRDVYGLQLLLDAVRDCKKRTGRMFRVAILLAQDARDGVERDFLNYISKELSTVLGDGYHLFLGEYAPPVIAASDAFLRPTFTDGDSVAIREACDAQVLTIASDVVPRPEGVVTFATGDAVGLSQCMESAMLNPRPGVSRSTGIGNDSGLTKILQMYSKVASNLRPQP